MLKPIVQDKLLFPKIIWSRPVNVYQRRGKILILGGGKEITKASLFCETVFYTGIKKISLGYPEILKGVYQDLLKGVSLPLDFSAYQEIKGKIKNYDLVTLGYGLSQSPETQKLIEEILKHKLPLLLNNQGVLEGKIDLYLKREYPTVFLVDLRKAASILKKQSKEIEETAFLSAFQLASKLKKTVVLVNENIFIAKPDQVVITKTRAREENLLGFVASLWSQNLNQPFEAACTASYLFKIWQENFKKTSEIKKALEKLEKEIK